MPIFEYHCHDCGATFERLTLRPLAMHLIECPQCGSTQTTKVFSTFSTGARTGLGGTATGSTGNATFS